MREHLLGISWVGGERDNNDVRAERGKWSPAGRAEKDVWFSRNGRSSRDPGTGEREHGCGRNATWWWRVWIFPANLYQNLPLGPWLPAWFPAGLDNSGRICTAHPVVGRREKGKSYGWHDVTLPFSWGRWLRVGKQRKDAGPPRRVWARSTC